MGHCSTIVVGLHARHATLAFNVALRKEGPIARTAGALPIRVHTLKSIVLFLSNIRE